MQDGGRKIGFGLLLLMGFALAACDSAEERAEAHYQRGLALLEADDVSRAMIEFRNVFELDPDHREARSAYADQLIEMGQISEAIDHVRHLVEQDWADVEGHKELAELALLVQDWEVASTHAKRAYELDPEDLDIRALKAATDYQEGRREAAIEMATEVIAARPENLHARMLLIAERMNREDYVQALDLVKDALVHAPENRDLHFMYVGLLERTGAGSEVEAQLRQMAELFPGDPDVIEARIKWYAWEGDLDSAEALLRERAGALPADTPERVEADLDLVLFLHDRRGAEAARAELAALAEATDVPHPYRRALAEIDESEGRTEAAIATLQELVAGTEPSNERRESQVALAALLFMTDRAEEGSAVLETVLAEDATHVGALKLRARSLIQADRPDDAIRDLRVALNQEPGDPQLLLLEAAAHERSGDYGLAGDLLARAVQASGRAPAETIQYAEFLLARGRADMAKAAIDESLHAYPDTPELLVTLARIHLGQENWDEAEQIARRLGAQENPEAVLFAAEVRAASQFGQNRTEEAFAVIESLADGAARAEIIARMVQSGLVAGEPRDLRSRIEGILDQAPDSLGVRMLRASLLALTGDLAGAEPAYRAIIAEEPDHAPAYGELYALLTVQGRGEEAASVLEAGLAATDRDPTLVFIQAGEREREGDFESAITLYEELYAQDTSSTLIANNLASLIASHREGEADLARAFAIARRLQGSEVPQFADTYGWILSRRGDHAQALTYLERAAAALPDDPLVHYHLGVAQHHLDLEAQARASFEQALAAAGPESPLPQMEEARRLIASLPETEGVPAN